MSPRTAVLSYKRINENYYTDAEGNCVKTAGDVGGIFRAVPSIRAEVGMKHIGGFFVKYTPRDCFKPYFGPSGPSVTAGFVLNF